MCAVSDAPCIAVLSIQGAKPSKSKAKNVSDIKDVNRDERGLPHAIRINAVLM